MDRLIIFLQHREEMKNHVKQCLPDETCGFIAGVGNRSVKVYPVTNQFHSADRFQMDAQEQLTAMLDIAQHGWDLLAIYHSHPQGPRIPSPTDLIEFRYPGVLYLIWYPLQNQWDCSAYHLHEGGYIEVAIDFYE